MSPEPYAKVIADSVYEHSEFGPQRVTTIEAGGWRPILAEQNTHRVFARNSASNRAIPITKNLKRFGEDFMYPAEWGAERPGMQPGPPLEGWDLDEAQVLWTRLANVVHAGIADYVNRHPLKDENNEPIEGAVRLHKSLLNRWLEIGLQQVQIITATNWDGYFWQRCHEAADPNIRLMAKAIKDARDASTPIDLGPGEWHLPYFGETGGAGSQDWDDVERLAGEPDNPHGPDEVELAKMISAGRCARVSYLNQNGVRDISDDIRLYEHLADRSDDPDDPPHASPLEHVATPWPDNLQMVTMPNGKTMGPLPKLGCLGGWWQMRHEELTF